MKPFLYFLLRILNDISAVSKGRTGKRIGRRIAGRVAGKSMRKLFK